MMVRKIKKRIYITGLGHIGVPTACILATAGYAVLGVDIDEKVLVRIRSAVIIFLVKYNGTTRRYGHLNDF